MAAAMVRIALTLSLICWLLATAHFPVAASAPPPPRTVTARDQAGAVILWDATPYIQRFSADGTSTKDALKALETEAVMLFVRNAATLARSEHHLRVVVSYAQTGAIDPRYQTKTFGIKTVLSVEGKIWPEIHFARNWQADLRRGVMPRGLKVEIARDLPTEAP